MSDYERTFVQVVDSPPRGLLIAYGASSLLLGVVLAVWPGETLVVVAVLIALQLLLGGASQLFLALVPTGLPTPARVLTGVTGLLALVLGGFCLFSPDRTLALVSILFGVWLAVAGVAELVLAFLDSGPARRIWDVLRAALSLLAGAVLILYPGAGLGLLVLVVSAWLIAFGVVTIVSALRHRRSAEPGAHTGRPVPQD